MTTNHELRQLLCKPSRYRRAVRVLRSLTERLGDAIFGTVERLLG
jgi:uncharacterized protein YjiS (DUF1127 family)